MKLNQIVVLLVLIFLMAFLGLSFKNSRSCKQLVIDSNEVITGLNMPPQLKANCYFDENRQLRVGLYQLEDPLVYLHDNGFKRIKVLDESELFWSYDLLKFNNEDLSNEEHIWYVSRGENRKNKWQCIVERTSGRMWMEVLWDKG